MLKFQDGFSINVQVSKLESENYSQRPDKDSKLY